MKYYELYQRLDYGYIKSATGLKIYLRSSLSVFLPKGVSLMAITSGDSPKWTIDYYLTMDNIATDDSLFEKIELLFLVEAKLPTSTDVASLETAVKTEVAKIIEKIPGDKFFTVVSKVYNEKKELVGQVTNTIANDGKVIII